MVKGEPISSTLLVCVCTCTDIRQLNIDLISKTTSLRAKGLRHLVPVFGHGSCLRVKHFFIVGLHALIDMSTVDTYHGLQLSQFVLDNLPMYDTNMF